MLIPGCLPPPLTLLPSPTLTFWPSSTQQPKGPFKAQSDHSFITILRVFPIHWNKTFIIKARLFVVAKRALHILSVPVCLTSCPTSPHCLPPPTVFVVHMPCLPCLTALTSAGPPRKHALPEGHHTASDRVASRQPLFSLIFLKNLIIENFQTCTTMQRIIK